MVYVLSAKRAVKTQESGASHDRTKQLITIQ